MRPLFDDRPTRIDVPDVDGTAAFVALVEHERAEFEVELGGPIVVGDEPGDEHGDVTNTLRIAIDPESTMPALERRGSSTIVATGATLDDATVALSLLRTMRRTGATSLRHESQPTPADAIDLVEAEVATTWPSFERTGIDWTELAARHRPDPDDPDWLVGLQRWVALLGDGHTNVHPRTDVAALPYHARLDGRHSSPGGVGRLMLADVPVGTVPHDAGVRAGDEMVAVDDAAIDLEAVAAVAGAPPQLKPWLVGRRVLSGPVGVERSFTVRRADGSEATFVDTPGANTWPDPVEWHRRPSGTGYLRIRRWVESDVEAIDAALDEFAGPNGADRLIVDLRGNPGGMLVVAVDFRRRFLIDRTSLGTVRFSTGDGGLSAPHRYADEPSADRTRWTRPVRFLIDALTYSSSEDALLGLRQLAHVEIVGEPSGGGSGRARTVPLHGDAVLTVSTALTYDHDGTCVEGAGIQVDRPATTVDDADRAW